MRSGASGRRGGTMLRRRAAGAAVVSLVAGFLLALALAKLGAPEETRYRLPHDFTVFQPTFLPSALPGAAVTGGNSVALLENGDAIFPSMLAAIAGATKSVNFEAYIFWSGEVGSRFRDALAAKARSGVEVRILIDAVGSPGRKLKKADVDALKAAGCRLEFFHPRKPWSLWVVNHRTHRRILVVDGRVGFTGGAGFADEWLGDADSTRHWRETQVRVEGPAVRGLQAAFQANWSEETAEALVGEDFFPAIPPAGGMTAAVIPSSPLDSMSGAGHLYAVAIAAATKRVWISNSYFLPDRATVALMTAAAKRGVDVRVIVPSDGQSDVPATKAAGRAAFGPLLTGGVRVFEYQPTMFHPKAMVVDGLVSTVGSANFDDRSFYLNEEINLVVHDAGFASRMEESFRRDLTRCRELKYQEWKKRPLKKRIGEWLLRPLRSEL